MAGDNVLTHTLKLASDLKDSDFQLPKKNEGINSVLKLLNLLINAKFAINNIQTGSVLFFGRLESKKSQHELLRFALGGEGYCCHAWLMQKAGCCNC